MIPAKIEKNVLENFTPKNEAQVFIKQAALKTPICLEERSKMIENLDIVIDCIGKDIGIKASIGDMDKARLMDITIKYFGYLSVSEIKVAFEMLMIGELDMFLPRDREGNPEKNHYQTFSTEYYTRIIRAYIRKKEKMIASIPRKELAAKSDIEEEIYYKILYNQMIQKEYEKFSETGEKPAIIFPFVLIQEMKEVGLVNTNIEISPAEITSFMEKYLRAIIKIGDKKQAAQMMKSGDIPKNAKYQLEDEIENDVIYNVFKGIKERNQDIKLFFPDDKLVVRERILKAKQNG